MTRVARNKTLFPYLLLIALGLFSLTFATERRKPSRVAQAPNPYNVGQWELSFSAPNPMSHVSVLPNGKVLFWTYNSPFTSTESYTWDCVLSNGLCNPDVNGNNLAAIPYNTSELFCSGHSLLPDGRLFVAGGGVFLRFGINATTIFNLDPLPSAPPPATSGPTMTDARWYPSTVTLGNGETAILSGDACLKGVPPDCDIEFNNIPEVLNSTGTSLRSLTGAERQLTWYPWVFVASDGRVFHAGPLSPSRWLNTTGTGAWGLTEKPYFYSQSQPFLTFREWGSAVMYDVDKVMISGGGFNTASETAETIDLTNEIGNWTPTDQMEFARRHHNLTILADGTVLATGGTQGEGFNNNCPKYTVREAELWNPGTGMWTTLAAMSKRRQYHSTAVLLKDGRVLVSGGTYDDATPNCDPLPAELQQEIFTPPYLFNPDGSPATRPNLTNAPETITYGTQFLVNTPSPISIGKVTMVRLSSVTHSTNMNQRINHLTFSRVGTGLRVNAPANGNLCPPGHYMLFIINNAGVPSVARTVKIQ